MTDTVEISPIKCPSRPCLDLKCNSEEVIAKIKRLDRKIPGREVEIPSDEEDGADDTNMTSEPDNTHQKAGAGGFHLKIEIVEDISSKGMSKPSPILRRSVTTDVYQAASAGGQLDGGPEEESSCCGKCQGHLNVQCPPSSAAAGARRASSYNRRTVSFCDDVGEIADLTTAPDSATEDEDEASVSSPGAVADTSGDDHQLPKGRRRRRSVEVLVSSKASQATAS